MNAKEYRIGNIIADQFGNVRSVCEINENGLKAQMHPDFTFYTAIVFQPSDRIENLLPIPLTEEWLLKFGFENESDLYFVLRLEEYTNMYYNKKDKTICIGVPYEAAGTEFIFLYVHQLQNLYFALTGVELTINEND